VSLGWTGDESRWLTTGWYLWSRLHVEPWPLRPLSSQAGSHLVAKLVAGLCSSKRPNSGLRTSQIFIESMNGSPRRVPSPIKGQHEASQLSKSSLWWMLTRQSLPRRLVRTLTFLALPRRLVLALTPGQLVLVGETCLERSHPAE
jgi:hypothetical protein